MPRIIGPGGLGGLGGLVLFGPALGWLAVAGLGLWAASSAPTADPMARRRATVVRSEACVVCHPEQHRTWQRSYHRTMTQSVDAPAAVLPPFGGEVVRGLGFTATMHRDDEGRPTITVRRPGQAEPWWSATVELTVGSHRLQQFVARMDRGGGPLERWRLPFAWHVERGEWMHLNQAFLTPDGTAGDESDYLRHLSRWNDNCIFCHNTEPVPGLDEGGRFASEVGEFGIACEACHGPASLHVRTHADPFVRLLAAGEGDATIAQPDRLGAGLGSDACGRCHGQRIGTDVAAVLSHGDGYLPGTPLREVSRPIFRDSRLASDPPDAMPFAERFWPDGTPRLSAYEYQGLLLSPCHDDGRGLGCGDCHTMHGADPNLQLRPSHADTCARCHEVDALSPGHRGHPAIACGGCHLPRITYGLLQGMMSHRITAPDPGRWVGRHDQPDACTQCHVDRSRSWAADAIVELGFEGTAPGRPAPDEAWAARVVLDLHRGDPIQRVLAAHALARPDAVGDRRARVSALVDGLDDEYPAVRWFAREGLRGLAEPDVVAILDAFEPMADVAERVPVVDRLRRAVGPGPLERWPERREALAEARDDRAIFIGE